MRFLVLAALVFTITSHAAEPSLREYLTKLKTAETAMAREFQCEFSADDSSSIKGLVSLLTASKPKHVSEAESHLPIVGQKLFFYLPNGDVAILRIGKEYPYEERLDGDIKLLSDDNRTYFSIDRAYYRKIDKWIKQEHIRVGTYGRYPYPMPCGGPYPSQGSGSTSYEFCMKHVEKHWWDQLSRCRGYREMIHYRTSEDQVCDIPDSQRGFIPDFCAIGWKSK
jgi:hypothetical protein